MAPSSCSSTATLLLVLLLTGRTAAGPNSDLQPPTVRSGACQEHRNLHLRLDIVEQRVEDTVDKLEAELEALLDTMEAPQWRSLLDAAGETKVDILQDPGQKDQS